MRLSSEKLKKILVSPGIISEEDFQIAEKEAEESKRSLQDVLLDKNLISDENLGKLIAEEIGFPFISLRKEAIAEEILKIIPEVVARKQQIIAFDRSKEGLKLAMSDPTNLDIIHLVAKKTGDNIVPYLATERDIEAAFDLYQKGLKEKYDEIIEKSIEEAGRVKIKEPPIVKIVDTILAYAYQNRASDIHIEPQRNKVVVRFRIDGVLHDVITIPREILNSVVTRIKILSKLRTDEHLAAQDGKMQQPINGQLVDIRVSIVPVTEGEKVVMRLLSEKARQYTLETLGLQPSDFKKVTSAIQKPYGMILVCGPTGCGKTTTLYSILKILNTRDKNIATIEDPVEYDIEGVNQIQVNPKTNLTFASGLRSILRQDPDIIMVGEIRDNETAGIAINAAMTGHLVLSTLHTNDAPTTLPRLLDMKAEPFLIASTVNIAIAQRLVRKICPKCITSYEIGEEEIEEMKSQVDEFAKAVLDKRKGKWRVYKGVGCKVCQMTGYSGRIGIFEVLEMKDNIKELVMKRADADQIRQQAIKNGMTTMLEDGIKKVIMGITTMEEVLRVTKE